MNSTLHTEFHRNNNNNNTNPDKSRDRHFVTWSEEEDNILREQVKIYGTERWSAIASQLRNKTGRQCRRRWNTYLSTPYKKGGWSQEEDRILFEAHQKFGNRWTEIAKIVQGRTDNAVKNRFNALCRKLQKKQSSSKENEAQVTTNENGKRVALKDETSVKTLDSTILCKNMRNKFVSPSERIVIQSGEHAMKTNNTSGILPGDATIKSVFQEGKLDSMLQPRVALSVLPHENITNLGQSGFLGHSSPSHAFAAMKTPMQKVAGSKLHDAFVKLEDPRVSALTQQAELLSSLAQRRKTDTANQEIENVWRAVDGKTEDQMKDQIPCPNLTTNTSTPLLTNENKWQNATCLPSKRLHMPSLPKLCEPCEKTSQECSDFSVGSSFRMNLDDFPKCNLSQIWKSDFVCENKSFQTSSANTEEKEQVPDSSEDGCSCSATDGNALSSRTTEQKDESNDPMSFEYSSPIRVIPHLRSFVDGIPSPHFSDSERQFLLSVLDPDSGVSCCDCQSPGQRSTPLCRISLSNRL